MKLVLTQNVTVDGVIEALDGWFEPAGDKADTSDIVDVVQRHMADQDGLLLGRRTFEELRGFWPNQIDDITGITDHLNQVDKYVVSATLDDPAWEPTVVLRGDPIEEITALKERPGGDLGITGSIELCHAVIAAGIVDEYRLFTYPVVLGRGRRLFPDGMERVDLEPVDTLVFRSGITLSTLCPA